MSGYVGNLNSTQETALQMFKYAVRDIENIPDQSDSCYLRWLREGKFNVRKTELKFRNYMEYRRKYGADTILQDYTPPAILEECLSGSFFGEDVDGHPVWYDNIGNLDPRGIYRSVESMEVIHKYKCYHHVLLNNKLQEFSQQRGRNIETVTGVIDLKNLSIKKHIYTPVIDHFKELLAVLQANNPGRIKNILLVNASPVFLFCYKFIKYNLDRKIRRLIVICNTPEQIQRYISPDQLPAMYGGNRFEPDAECSDYIRPGRDVPERYFFTNHTTVSREQMTWVHVGRISTHKVRHVVNDPGTTLQWEFFSLKYDIPFRLTMNRKVGWRKIRSTIAKTSHAESHFFPQKGQHKCLAAGEYVFKFRNSHWIHRKNLSFSIRVQPVANENEHTPSPVPQEIQFTQHKVLDALTEITREWSSLALALEIPVYQIDEIETNYPNNVIRCKERMVNRWFQRGTELSWSRLCQALRDRLVERHDIANAIEQAYS